MYSTVASISSSLQSKQVPRAGRVGGRLIGVRRSGGTVRVAAAGEQQRDQQPAEEGGPEPAHYWLLSTMYSTAAAISSSEQSLHMPLAGIELKPS